VKRAALLAALALAACGHGDAPDPRYPSRPTGCGVLRFPETPNVPVDDLGSVTVDCTGEKNCARLLMDAVCRRGGDVLYGFGENPISSERLTGKAAHTTKAPFPPRPEGCDVTLYAGAPAGKTENIGPVAATCSLDTSDDDCARTLKDAVCTLGGDVVWGVGPASTGDDAKKHMKGRAAHTMP
jgi:hypothetical protein